MRKISTVHEIEDSKTRNFHQRADGASSNFGNHDCLRNPNCSRTKGRGGASTSHTGIRAKRSLKCSICKGAGHKKFSCSRRRRKRHYWIDDDDAMSYAEEDPMFDEQYTM